jgi:ATPase subunit of ABC transporter with duplicated ATPase domains
MEFEIEGTLKYATSNYQLTISEPIHIADDKGKVIAIMGENGSGKTTLIRAILGDPVVDFEGKVSLTYGGKRPRVVFMPQDVIAVERPLTMRDYIGFQEWMERLVEELGIPLDATTNEVSSGTLKKAQILKMLFSEGDMYVLDEPTTYIDRAAKRTIANIVNDRMEMGKWFFISGNDPYFLGEVATDIIYMVVTPENKATANFIVIKPLPGMAGIDLRKAARDTCSYLTQYKYKKKRAKMKQIVLGEVPDVV